MSGSVLEPISGESEAALPPLETARAATNQPRGPTKPRFRKTKQSYLINRVIVREFLQIFYRPSPTGRKKRVEVNEEYRVLVPFPYQLGSLALANYVRKHFQGQYVGSIPECSSPLYFYGLANCSNRLQAEVEFRRFLSDYMKSNALVGIAPNVPSLSRGSSFFVQQQAQRVRAIAPGPPVTLLGAQFASGVPGVQPVVDPDYYQSQPRIPIFDFLSCQTQYLLRIFLPEVPPGCVYMKVTTQPTTSPSLSIVSTAPTVPPAPHSPGLCPAAVPPAPHSPGLGPTAVDMVGQGSSHADPFAIPDVILPVGTKRSKLDKRARPCALDRKGERREDKVEVDDVRDRRRERVADKERLEDTILDGQRESERKEKEVNILDVKVLAYSPLSPKDGLWSVLHASYQQHPLFEDHALQLVLPRDVFINEKATNVSIAFSPFLSLVFEKMAQPSSVVPPLIATSPNPVVQSPQLVHLAPSVVEQVAEEAEKDLVEHDLELEKKREKDRLGSKRRKGEDGVVPGRRDKVGTPRSKLEHAAGMVAGVVLDEMSHEPSARLKPVAKKAKKL